MPLNLHVNDISVASLSLINTDDQSSITATFSNIKFLIDDTVVANVDSSGKITGVSDGTTGLSVSAKATFTDKEGNLVTKDLVCHLWNYPTP